MVPENSSSEDDQNDDQGEDEDGDNDETRNSDDEDNSSDEDSSEDEDSEDDVDDEESNLSPEEKIVATYKPMDRSMGHVLIGNTVVPLAVFLGRQWWQRVVSTLHPKSYALKISPSVPSFADAIPVHLVQRGAAGST